MTVEAGQRIFVGIRIGAQKAAGGSISLSMFVPASAPVDSSQIPGVTREAWIGARDRIVRIMAIGTEGDIVGHIRTSLRCIV